MSRQNAMDFPIGTIQMWPILVVGMALMPACDCRQRSDPFSGVPEQPHGSRSDDVRWDDISKRVGAPVPNPGAPPTFEPLVDRSVATLEAQPRVLAKGPYSRIVLGRPPLALRTDNLSARSSSDFRYTLVALDETGPRELVTKRFRYRHIVRDERYAYCAGEGGLDRIDIADGTTTHLADGPTQAMAVSETYVYWVNGGHAMLNEPLSTMYRQSKSGGEIERLYGNLPYIMDLAPRGDRIYWIAKMRPRRLMDQPPGYVAHAAVNGQGDPVVETFSSQRPAGLVIEENAAYILTEGTLGESFDGSFLNGYVLRRPHGETRWRTLADSQALPSSLVHDGTRLCWYSGSSDGYDIRCVANSGGPLLQVARGLQRLPSIDLHDGELAWTGDPRGVMTVSLTEVAPE